MSGKKEFGMQNILALLGDGHLNEEVLKRAFMLAKQFDAKVIILQTIHVPFVDLPNYSSELPLDKREVRDQIQAKIASILGDQMVDYHLLVFFGEATDRAIIEAKRDGIDLIITTEDIKIDRLARSVHKPILIQKNPTKAYNNILIATDLKEGSIRAIEYIKSNFPSAKISLVYAYESMVMMTSMYDISYLNIDPYQEQNRIIAQDLFESLQKREGVSGVWIEATPSVPLALLDYIEEGKPDLVVVASSNKEGLLFGSVSAYIARESTVDVLVYGDNQTLLKRKNITIEKEQSE